MQVQVSAKGGDGYLIGRRQAWFAYVMTIALMIFDYVDRQVIVTLFPHLKAEWGLSDVQLGALVSVVSVTVALFGIPVALIADRFSRVKSIVAMALIWSLATISCMFGSSYAQLIGARAMVGCGEAGYGSVGAAMIATHFPERMRAGLLGGFFASASVGSVLGVVLGGVVAAKWGWQSAFGVVGFPGLILALLYLLVRDYRTPALAAHNISARKTATETARQIAAAIFKPKTTLWVCLGAAAELIVVSTIWAWLPSYLNRHYGMPTDQAAMRAAAVVLAGALGSVFWGAVVDRVGRNGLGRKLYALAALCVLAMLVSMLAFAAPLLGLVASANGQVALVALGIFLATCTVGPASAVVINVIHPSVRATGSSVLSLFQNLFGLAAGPLIAGALSDRFGLDSALIAMPLFCVAAAGFFLLAARTYEADVQRVRAQVVAQNDPEYCTGTLALGPSP